MATAVAALVAPVAATPRKNGDRHQIGRGETLGHVAKRYGVSVEALASANGIADPNRVYAGWWVTIPAKGTGAAPGGGGGDPSAGEGSTTLTVAAGQNLTTIARRYGVSVSALCAANGIAEPNLIVIGTRLTVPSAAGPDTGGRPAAVPSRWPLRLRKSPGRQALAPTFDLWAAAYGVPPDLAKAMTWLESGWQSGVISSTGAVGIGQLMPHTVDFMRLLIGDATLDPADAGDNVRMSIRYLRWLLDQTGGDSSKALAGYYQGLQSLLSRGMYGETVAYVNGVQQLRSNF